MVFHELRGARLAEVPEILKTFQLRTVLVTGAEGFVGRGLTATIVRAGFAVRRAVRSTEAAEGAPAIVTGDIAKFRDWHEITREVDAVVHLAARAHITSAALSGDVSMYRPTNVDATMRLAEAALARGVRRFVFVSSIGVHGNSLSSQPFTEASPPAPIEPYAISKLEAERGLRELLGRSATELVVVRPTLTYGPGVKGNLLRLMRLVASGLPIPLGAFNAPKSFVGLKNLCALLVACIDHPRAAGETFLAAEPKLQSTASMLEMIASFMPSRGRIWRWPVPLVRLASACLGKGGEIAKLAQPLYVNPIKSMTVLNWQPAVSFHEGIADMVDCFARTCLGPDGRS
jgi:nucleoside-diphosphate-sugar epimerase